MYALGMVSWLIDCIFFYPVRTYFIYMETSILPMKRCKNYIFAWLLSPFSKDGYLSHYTRCNTGSAQSNHPMHLIIFHDTHGVMRTKVAVKNMKLIGIYYANHLLMTKSWLMMIILITQCKWNWNLIFANGDIAICMLYLERKDLGLTM